MSKSQKDKLNQRIIEACANDTSHVSRLAYDY